MSTSTVACTICGDPMPPELAEHGEHRHGHCVHGSTPSATLEEVHAAARRVAEGIIASATDGEPLGIQQWAHDWKVHHGDDWYPLVVQLAHVAAEQIAQSR
jgi:hypothetical protein